MTTRLPGKGAGSRLWCLCTKNSIQISLTTHHVGNHSNRRDSQGRVSDITRRNRVRTLRRYLGTAPTTYRPRHSETPETGATSTPHHETEGRHRHRVIHTYHFESMAPKLIMRSAAFMHTQKLKRTGTHTRRVAISPGTSLFVRVDIIMLGR